MAHAKECLPGFYDSGVGGTLAKNWWSKSVTDPPLNFPSHIDWLATVSGCSVSGTLNCLSNKSSKTPHVAILEG